MKTLKSLTTLTLCLLSAFGASIVLSPQQAKAEKACSNRSLYGTYSAQSTGFVNNTDPLAVTGLLTYDGNGNVNGTILVRSVAGNVTTNIRTQGTYQVNSDCSLTESFTRSDGTTANYSGALFDDGNKYALSETDSGTTVNVQAQRVRNYNPSRF